MPYIKETAGEDCSLEPIAICGMGTLFPQHKILTRVLTLQSMSTPWSSRFGLIPVAATERERIRPNPKGT